MLKRSSDNRLNGGQVIVDYLIREKVPYAFGLCGHGNIQFIDALHERQDDIKTISVHHESVCGFMADAYYRVKGQPVATFTSCGPAGDATRGAGGPEVAPGCVPGVDELPQAVRATARSKVGSDRERMCQSRWTSARRAISLPTEITATPMTMTRSAAT